MYQKHTAEEWKEIVSQLKASSLSQKAFCKDKNIASTTLDYWKRKYSQSPKQKGFVKVTNPLSKYTVAITLHIGSTFLLEIPETITEERLKNIIGAIKACL